MKIYFWGLENIKEGKVKYDDPVLNALAEKLNPKKISPYFVEFISKDALKADSIAVHTDHLLDVLFPDMEIIESRLSRVTDETESSALKKALHSLEQGIPLSDASFTEQEYKIVNALKLITLSPVLVCGEMETNELIKNVFEKSEVIFFYTAGANEVHGWLVKKNSDIVTCADKIHSDLAKGFIRAEIVNFENFMKCHNFNDAKAKGFVRLIDRNYIINPGDIVDIRFNV